MLVHVIGSRGDIVNEIEYFRSLVSSVHKEGHSLVKDWIEPSYNSLKTGKAKWDLDWTNIYKESLEAINKADVIIAETTSPSFSVGYQVAMAMQMKKPTLVLNRTGIKESPFASGIEAGIVYRNYNVDNLNKIIVEFLKENDIQTKDMRFNFFIDRPIYNYLRWTAHKTGKTKAEILRDLVVREIDRDIKPPTV